MKEKDIAEKILSLYGIGGYFAHIAGMNHAETDTKSGLIKRVCALENIVPGDEVLMVGDSQYDYKGAKEAGVDFLGVSYGYGFEGTEVGIRFVGDFAEIKTVLPSPEGMAVPTVSSVFVWKMQHSFFISTTYSSAPLLKAQKLPFAEKCTRRPVNAER